MKILADLKDIDCFVQVLLGGKNMDRFERLQELISEFVNELDAIGFEVLGENEGISLILEIVDRDQTKWLC